MAAFIPEEGQLAALKLIADNADWYVMIFTNVPTIDGDTVLADLTPATFDGADDIQLDSWGAPATVGGKAKIVHPQVAWTLASGAGQTLKGAAIYDTDGKIILIKLFASDRTLVNVGDQLKEDVSYSFFDSTLA